MLKIDSIVVGSIKNRQIYIYIIYIHSYTVQTNIDEKIDRCTDRYIIHRQIDYRKRDRLQKDR